jgi:GNAT superfamily N-acetyltransferase
MTKGRVTIKQYGSDNAARIRPVGRGLSAYNRKHAPRAVYRVIQMLAHDARGRLVGGLYGSIGYRWLFTRWLWIADSHQRTGLGTRMMDRAEAFAQKHGCLGAWVDTFEFQARPFYEKRGYRLFGTIEDYPPPFKRFFLKKRFVAKKRAPRSKA